MSDINQEFQYFKNIAKKKPITVPSVCSHLRDKSKPNLKEVGTNQRPRITPGPMLEKKPKIQVSPTSNIDSTHDNINSMFSNDKKIPKPKQSDIFPEIKVVVDKDILYELVQEIKQRHPDKHYTRRNLGVENALNRGDPLSKDKFDNLENLLNRKIPHTLVIGKKYNVILNLEKSDLLAELIGIVLGRGYINISKWTYRVVIFLKGHNKHPDFENYLKKILVKLFKLDDSRLKSMNYDDGEQFAIAINSIPVVYELCKFGIPIGKDTDINVPDWIFEEESYQLACLRGLININSNFEIYMDSNNNPNFRISFQKYSELLINDFKKLCKVFGIETTKIYDKSGNDYTSYKTLILSKESISKVLFEIVKPIIWKIEKKYIEEYFKNHNVSLESVLQYDDTYLERKSYDYSREEAEKYRIMFEMLGNFKLVAKALNLSNILKKSRIISHVKRLFQEPDYIRAYGIIGYDRWYKNNKKIYIGDDVDSLDIPTHVNTQVYRKIFQVLNSSLFLADDSLIINEVYTFFLNTRMDKKSNISSPDILKFGRIAYLIKNSDTRKVLTEYFIYIIKFTKKVKKITELKQSISYSQLAREFNVLFKHHQYVKQVIDDINDIFNIKLKIGIKPEKFDYKWHQLIFRWNYKNFNQIDNSLLYGKLGALLEKIEEGNYDPEMFSRINDSCSNFRIQGTIKKPLTDAHLQPHVDFLIRDKAVIVNSELGKKLVKYIESAEKFYKNKFSNKLSEIFSVEGNIFHDYLQEYIFNNDDNIIVTELLVWLEINDISIIADYLTGHMDFLFYYNNCLNICDYKPEQIDTNFIRTMPQVAGYGLILREYLSIPNLKVRCITFNKVEAWEYKPSILLTHINPIVDELKKTNPSISNKWKKYFKNFISK